MKKYNILNIIINVIIFLWMILFNPYSDINIQLPLLIICMIPFGFFHFIILNIIYSVRHYLGKPITKASLIVGFVLLFCLLAFLPVTYFFSLLFGAEGGRAAGNQYYIYGWIIPYILSGLLFVIKMVVDTITYTNNNKKDKFKSQTIQK